MVSSLWRTCFFPLRALGTGVFLFCFVLNCGICVVNGGSQKTAKLNFCILSECTPCVCRGFGSQKRALVALGVELWPSYEPLDAQCGHWKLSLDPVEVQQVFLTIKPSLSSQGYENHTLM